MTPKLSFHGAAGTVTGSCYLVEHQQRRFLVDCGLFQGSKTLRELNYGRFPFAPADIDFVLLTHAHIDHSGLLPKLYKQGFRNPILASAATRDLLSFMLPDAGAIQEYEVERLNRRNERRGRPQVTPIYGRDDAEACLDLIRDIPFDEWVIAGPGVRGRYWNAGHILGAASIEVEIVADAGGDRPLRLLFSGDLGPQQKAFHEKPSGPADLDYLVVESTYGDRDRSDPSPEERRALLKQEVQAALKAGGNLLIPAFAVERTQELLYDLGVLLGKGELPRTLVFLDSPLAIKVTEAFERNIEVLPEIADKRNPFRNANIRFVESAQESRNLSDYTSGAIIIAASGMCEAGRIRHHLKDNLWRPQATVLFVGYQAPGTLGSIILGGAKAVRIHGDEIRVQARIRSIDSYSAHADQTELYDWVCDRLPVGKAIFLTHGEETALRTLQDRLIEAGCGPDQVFVPSIDETFELVYEGRPAHRREAPRIAAEKLAPTDWHNEYAALLLDLAQELQALPGDAERARLLHTLRQRILADQTPKS